MEDVSLYSFDYTSKGKHLSCGWSFGLETVLIASKMWIDLWAYLVQNHPIHQLCHKWRKI